MLYSKTEVRELIDTLTQLTEDVEMLTAQLEKAQQLNQQLIVQNCELYMGWSQGEASVTVH